jgi:hypothetical protein
MWRTLVTIPQITQTLLYRFFPRITDLLTFAVSQLTGQKCNRDNYGSYFRNDNSRLSIGQADREPAERSAGSPSTRFFRRPSLSQRSRAPRALLPRQAADIPPAAYLGMRELARQ